MRQVKKETLLDPLDLSYFRNHSSQMAALDYLVSLESDLFVPTYDGNMAKVVEGHRRYGCAMLCKFYAICTLGSLQPHFSLLFRYLGFKKTIELDKRVLVGLIDQYSDGKLSWDEFSSAVTDAHANRMGRPQKRSVISDRPKEEDYFYSNPHECLAANT